MATGCGLGYTVPTGFSNNREKGGFHMGYATCTVTENNNSVSCNPDPIPVSRATENGVTWTFAQSGYTFTGVLIGQTRAPTGDFGTPTISTNAAGRSVMNVSDTVADLGDYSYTLLYTDPQGREGRFDPTIRNNP